MQRLVLNIEENRYELLLQFLRTLEYVKIESVTSKLANSLSPVSKSESSNQLALLMEVLQQQSKPLFQDISDPAAWQKQQRDEWS